MPQSLLKKQSQKRKRNKVMKVAVKNLENKSAGEITLDDSRFAVDVEQDILHRMVNYQLNKRRLENNKVKKRGAVAGGGKKTRKQKGWRR